MHGEEVDVVLHRLQIDIRTASLITLFEQSDHGLCLAYSFLPDNLAICFTESNTSDFTVAHPVLSVDGVTIWSEDFEYLIDITRLDILLPFHKDVLTRRWIGENDFERKR